MIEGVTTVDPKHRVYRSRSSSDLVDTIFVFDFTLLFATVVRNQTMDRLKSNYTRQATCFAFEFCFCGFGFG